MEVSRPPRRARFDNGDPDVVDLRPSIEANLGAFERVRSPSAQSGAAVAVVVMENGGRPVVPIFQRSAGMRRHAGQMALPGGRVHEGESAAEAALRELHEELGLEVSPDGVLGFLDDFDTVSGFTITPVVAWSSARGSSLRPSTAEVARLLLVGLDELQEAAAVADQGSSFSLKLPEVQIFAPTAAILYQFSEVALGGRAVRVADFFQPPWTHR